MSGKSFISAQLYIALLDNTPTKEKKKTIVKCLKDVGINDPFIADSNNTPLHIAVKSGNLEIVTFLLQHGADVNLLNNDYETALDIAKELKTETACKIIEILENSEIIANQVDFEIKEESQSFQNDNTKHVYQKRAGTAGIEGQLYETKILSLVLIRALVHSAISQFYLGTSLSGIDALDDVCIRYQRSDEITFIFLQAKHRIDENKSQVTFDELWKSVGDGQFSLLKYFRSYLKIKERFERIGDDTMFEGEYQAGKSIFVIYTPAKHNLTEKFVKASYFDPIAYDLIWSGKECDKFQYQYTEEDVKKIKNTILTEDIKTLANNLYMYKDKYMKMETDKYINKYHVLLAQKVFNISEPTTMGYRWGTFRDDFLSSNDEFLLIIKVTIFRAVVNETKINKVGLKKLIRSVKQSLTIVSLSELLQNINVCLLEKTHKLKILDERLKEFNDSISSITVSLTIFNNALEDSIKKKIGSLQIKLPRMFGNTDIAIKKDKRLDYLAEEIKNILSKTDGETIVINKSVIGPNNLIKPTIMETAGLKTAIGNLLILDDTAKKLKFNANINSSSKQAHKLLILLQSKIKNLDVYRLQIDLPDFPKLTFEEECNEIITKDFLNNLWFFTCQAKEHEIEKYAQDELYKYHNLERRNNESNMSSFRCDAIFLKMHDKIQHWWLKGGESYYVTKDLKDYSNIINDFENKSTLTILNYIYITKMYKYKIEFNEDSLNYSHFHDAISKLVIETNADILTGIKLIQYTKKNYLEFGEYSFLDLDYVLSISTDGCRIIMDELKDIKLNTLFIIFGNNAETKHMKQDFIINIINKHFTKKIAIVIDTNSSFKIEELTKDIRFERKTDSKMDFIDLVSTSQSRILEKYLIFQGIEVKWNSIINSESQYLIKANLLERILTNEKIHLGKALTNSKYEEIKNLYVPRTLRCLKALRNSNNTIDSSSHSSFVLFPYNSSESDERIVVHTLDDLNNIVVLLAAPGMGKSTFLTYLSITMKETNPNLWIERINLIDHEKYFEYCHTNKININKYETLKFICNAVLSKRKPTCCMNNDEKNSNHINIDIELRNRELILLKIENANTEDLLTIETFIYYYNKGATIFLFDGFDEIDSDFKSEVILFLKSMALLTVNEMQQSCNRKKIWITSRSYNNIRRTLESEFGNSYILEPFSEMEQDMFIENYMKIYVKLQELNDEQFKNIDGLFEYIQMFANREGDGKKLHFKHSDLLLRGLYIAVVKYFQSEIKHLPLDNNKKIFTDKWKTLKFIRYNDDAKDPHYNSIYKLNEVISYNKNMQNLIETPLHLSIAIEYIAKIIKNPNAQIENAEKWNLDVNTYKFFTCFFEEKLKTIVYKEKSHIYVFNKKVKALYKKDWDEFIEKHKQIAFYSLFKNDSNEIFTNEIADKIKNIIKGMESGEETTGVVDYVIKGVPKFVHYCFAEHLAVEYISDLIKTTPNDKQIRLWMFLLHKMFFKKVRGILSVFELKLCNDIELKHVILNINAEVKIFIFKQLIAQNKDPSNTFHLVVLDDLVVHYLRHTAITLLTVITDIVTVESYDIFRKFLHNTTFYYNASLTLGFDELLIIVENCARRIHQLKNPASNIKAMNETETKEFLKLIKAYQKYVCDKMGITNFNDIEKDNSQLRYGSIYGFGNFGEGSLDS